MYNPANKQTNANENITTLKEITKLHCHASVMCLRRVHTYKLFDEDIDGDSIRGCFAGGADELAGVDGKLFTIQHLPLSESNRISLSIF